jgi:hypothetical protein
VIESDCKRQDANKSNHPIQNPSLLVTEARTLYFSGRINEYITSVAREIFTIGIIENMR